MKEIREELQKRRRVLEIAVATAKGQTRGDTDQRKEMTKDPYGSASMTHDDEMGADLLARRKRDLQKIDHALAEIDAGRYGACEDCGEQINTKRLKAMPFGTRCLQCQASTEQQFGRAA
jgi:DnaK suppressor protein